MCTGSSSFGGVFFNEFDGMSETQWVMFPVSILVTLWGVTRLAYDMGKMYGTVLTKLRLKKKEDPRLNAMQRWSERRNVVTMSMWGGMSDVGTFMPTQNTEMFRPLTIRNMEIELSQTQVRSESNGTSPTTEDAPQVTNAGSETVDKEAISV